MQSVGEIFSQFVKRRGGNVATTFALTLIPLITVLGVAVDFSRTESSSRQAQYALDSAVLAASRGMQDDMTDTEIREVGRAYFSASAEANGVSADCANPTFEIDRVEYQVSASVSCTQPTTLTGILGIEELDFTRDASTDYGVGLLDIVFMFDTSGSMNSNGRMSDLQHAARSAVQTLLQANRREPDDVRIAISTYATSVNVGEEYFEAVTDAEPNQTECTRWERRGNSWRCSRYTQVTSTCVTGREGSNKYTDAAPGSGAWIAYDTTSCNSATITPLTSHQGSLISAISTLPTNGNTAGHLGIAWAWYLISPEWASIWGADSTPHDYDEPDSTKVAILMTDGAFNTDYMSGGDSFTHAQNFCDAMKDEGIVIYTVAFQAPQQGQNILNYCSSGTGFAFSASNGDELADAYDAIANNISDLRISR